MIVTLRNTMASQLLRFFVLFFHAAVASFILRGPLSGARLHSVSGQQSTPRHPSSLASSSWFDNLVPEFLRGRDGDFERLKDSDKAFGPGPLVVLYNFPPTIDDSEIDDMVSDAAPKVHGSGYSICRIHDVMGDPLLDLTLSDALDAACRRKPGVEVGNPFTAQATTVLFFSGFTNPDMMAVYNIVGKEVFLETSRSPACAKAVPNAMQKTLRQVLTEISGDHEEATSGAVDNGQPKP